ncbi:hypothetical protein Tco_0829611 [Tanacetum coccineum]
MFESGSYRSQPEHAALYDALEASMDHENREEFIKTTAKSCKRRHDDQDPPPPPSKDSDQSKKKGHDSDVSASKQCQAQTSSAWKTSDTNSEDTSAAHLPKIKTRPDLLKPVLEDERPETPKPDWAIWDPSSNGIASRLGTRSSAKLIWNVQLLNLVNPEGNRVVPDMSKPLPLGGPLGQVTIQPHYFFNKDMEYLVSGDKERSNALSISKLEAAYYPEFRLEELVPSLWFKSKCEYDISAAYVRSHMRILSVVSLKTFSRYGYTYLKVIVLCRADYKEYKILEADFKNLHLNDFKDLYLLHVQGNLNHLSGADKVHLFNTVNLWIRNIVIRQLVEDLKLRIESYQTKLNLTQPSWDATDFLFKEYYTIVHKTRAVIYRYRNNQKKMMRESEVHKFSDGTLTRILEKSDHMVKDYVLFKFNPGMEHRIWSEDDKRRSKEFIKVVESYNDSIDRY